MGITKGQLRKLGFKLVNKHDLIYPIERLSSFELDHNLYNYFILPKGKTIIFYINRDNSTPLVHLDEVTYREMQDFLRSIKTKGNLKLKNQIEDF